jgi:hypothetical protein
MPMTKRLSLSNVNLLIPIKNSANAANRTLKDIGDELITIPDATISLLSSMTAPMPDFKAFPNQTVYYTARSLGCTTVGHNIHHCRLLKEKYLL